MSAKLTETNQDPSLLFHPAYTQPGFTAVVPQGTHQGRQNAPCFYSADLRKVFQQLRLLEHQLFIMLQVLKFTGTADSEMGTTGHHPVVRFPLNFNELSALVSAPPAEGANTY
jgi:hypothetical protein